MLFISTFGLAQNFVPNPSFEEYKQLPCGVNQFYIDSLLKNWTQPIPTTTDYWNMESDSLCFLNPANLAFKPHNGNGMIGLITLVIDQSNSEYKEYIQAKLYQPLTKNSSYKVSFYTTPHYSNNFSQDVLESNNLGVAFTTQAVKNFSIVQPYFINIKPKVEEKEIMHYKNEWQLISECFIADSAYQYILIGNFNTNDETNFTRVTSNYNDGIAYYFIDDVTLEELPYEITLPTSTTFCPDQPFVTLNAFVENAISYDWGNESSDPILKVTEKATKEYVVKIAFDECIYTQEFTVKYLPKVKLGADTILCHGEILKLNPKHPLKNYVWEDGSTDSLRFISAPGIYSVSIRSECDIIDSVEVKYVNCPGFMPNIITPNDDSFNDSLVFTGIENRSWSIRIFNRWGQEVFFSERYENDWDGKDLSDGTYYYELKSKELMKSVKGWIQIKR